MRAIKSLRIMMMALVLIVAIVCLTGCASNRGTSEEVSSIDSAERTDSTTFELLDNEKQANGCFIRVYRDKLTDVIWVEDVFQAGYKGGVSFTPRLNADGKPMTYEQYKQALDTLND